MKTFDDLYVESRLTASFTIGFAEDTKKKGSDTGGDKIEGFEGRAGQVFVHNRGGTDAVVLDAATASVRVGGNGQHGSVTVVTAEGSNAIVLEAGEGSLTIGASGTNGDLRLQSKAGEDTVIVRGATANITLGGAGGQDGNLTIKAASGANSIVMDGSSGQITMGGVGINADIVMKNSNDIETIKITGGDGDIQFLNADLAEEFDVDPARAADVCPGTVVVLDDAGSIVPCDRPYDSKVVGIVAGAGEYRPGIVLDKNGNDNRRPIALAGKVYCWVDADVQPVRVGDLLTTSGRMGHAMVAADRFQAFGSSLGKALRSLDRGTGLIPVLVKTQ